MSPPVGPTGLATTCRGDADEETSPRWRVGANYAAFESQLRFTGSRDATLRQQAVALTLDRVLDPRTTLQFGLGASLGGSFLVDGAASAATVAHDVHPGALASVAYAWRIVDDVGYVPFVLLSGSIAAAYARIEERVAGAGSTGLTSIDFRAGIAVGKTFFHALTPYLVARAFGGPVFARVQGESIVGGDRHHYQLGAGLAVQLSHALDASIEGAPVGERRISVGVGYAF